MTLLNQEGGHTPAPWRQSERTSLTIESVAGRPICSIGYQQNWDVEKSSQENLANAELIVRAVNSHEELLSALQGCVSYRNWELAEGGVVPPELIDTFKRAEAALLKASGGQS